MAENGNHVARLAPPATSPAESPTHDVSPGTKVSSGSTAVDYFSIKPTANGGQSRTSPDASTITITLSSTLQESQENSSRKSSNDSGLPQNGAKRVSGMSVTFRQPRNPSLPQGNPRKTDNRRLRESSPSPVRFEQHVGFDNLPVGEATKNNPSSFTLQARHQGYHPTRRSRTFMIGVDEHAYSDYALVWLLTNMVDDGDEVVCVRVIETPFRPGERNYQEEAKKLLEQIQSKNELNRAISIILEYSVGKLHDTFQQLLLIYNPSMLVVGTKGRSLGGFQGLVNSRNSFSKYCLQYSPIPVVVVRPDEKRMKKKEKRAQDPNRQSYAAMLAYNQGKHEADSETSSLYEFEKNISADEEAHQVAAAIGLPARFDPTIKPYRPRSTSRPRRSSPSPLASSKPSPRATSISPPPAPLVADSGDEDSGDDEDEFEVMSGDQLLARGRSKAAAREKEKEEQKKKRLHDMEVGEAAALLQSGKSRQQLDEDDDDDDSQERTSGDATTTSKS